MNIIHFLSNIYFHFFIKYIIIDIVSRVFKFRITLVGCEPAKSKDLR